MQEALQAGMQAGFRLSNPSFFLQLLWPFPGCDSSPCDKILGIGDGSGRLHPHCKSQGPQQEPGPLETRGTQRLDPGGYHSRSPAFLPACRNDHHRKRLLPSRCRAITVQAIAQRDLMVVKNLVLVLAATVVLINFLVDLLYAVLDPRLRLGFHG